MVEPPAENDSAADSGADGDAQGMHGPAGCSSPALTQYRAVCVVVNLGGAAQPFREPVAQREINPAEVRRKENHALRPVQRPRSARADADVILAAVESLKDGIATKGRMSPASIEFLLRFATQSGVEFEGSLEPQRAEGGLWTNAVVDAASKR